MTSEIPLGKDAVAIVDDEDYERVSALKWHVYGDRYAAHSVSVGKRRVKQIPMHRFILGCFDTTIAVDHVNRDGFDNRRENLRTCTRSQNQQNRRRHNKAGRTSKFKGVVYRSDGLGWMARITINRRFKYLGTFATEVEAAVAYNEAAKELFGEFAYLNKVEEDVDNSVKREN